MRLTFYYALLLLLFACAEATPPHATEQETSSVLIKGPWEFRFDLGDGDILTQSVDVDSLYRFTFHNGEEQIQTDPMTYGRDSIYLEMPVYHTYFIAQRIDSASIKGHWFNPDKGDYSIPFTASFSGDRTHLIPENPVLQSYRVAFSPDSEDEYPAIARFSSDGEHLTGTFETETGDYRYLAGIKEGNEATIQCFDGSHVFYFNMTMTGDSLKGIFKSGTHWKEPFSGVLDNEASLRDPFEITKLTSDQSIGFPAMSLDGEMHQFNAEQFQGKVTIIQIFGSWCPNCLDESRYFIDLYKRYHDQGLEIIPVAFERSADFTTTANRLNNYRSELGIPYDIYVGGNAKKSAAEELFPMLSSVSSFPTSLIVDPQGQVRHIHTGFYGPGTGENYDNYRDTTEKLIEQLLVETGV